MRVKQSATTQEVPLRAVFGQNGHDFAEITTSSVNARYQSLRRRRSDMSVYSSRSR